MGAAEDYAATAKAWREKNWNNGGTTATATTESQNLANAYNSGVNPAKPVIPTPYISGVLDQAKKDTAAQQGSVPPTPSPSPTPQPTVTAQPVSAGNSYPAPEVDYAAKAAARFAATLAQKRSIATTQKASLDRSFARDSQITNDNRTLENGQINRTLSPFSGKTAFDKGMIGRERTLVDENKSGNLAAQKAGIDDLLAAYESATADEQVRIMDELQARDRQYQLDLSQQTGNLNGTRTLAGQQFDWNTSPNNPTNIGQNLNNQGQALTNQLNELKIGNYSTEVKQQAALFEQEYKKGNLTNEALEYNLKQAKDPNSPVNQISKLELQMKQLEAKNLPEQQRLELQQLKKQIAQIGVVHYKPQTDVEKQMDQVQLDTAKKQLEILSGKAPTSTPIPSKDSTNNLAYYQDQTDNSTHSKADKLAFAAAHQNELSDADYRAWVASINKGD